MPASDQPAAASDRRGLAVASPKNGKALASGRFRADIQGLRAIAVLAVIANHFAGWPRGGFVGVDVFFVISGYLITGLLVREFDRRGRVSLRSFYARRIKRILPMALLVIGATVLAARVLAGIDRYHTTARDAIYAVLFAANWHFASTGVDYFAQSLPPSPLQHYWSLSVEEQFYVVWPTVLGLLLLGCGVRKLRASGERAVALAVLALCAASFVWALHQTQAAPTIAYFSTFARAWELGVGALVAILARTADRLWIRWRTTVVVLGVAGILVACLVVPPSPGFPAPWGLLPVLCTAAVLACGAGLDSRVLAPLVNPVSRYLGRISYSLYLWHFPVAILIVAVFARCSAGYWVVGLLLIFALSAVSNRFVEEPARHGRWFHRSGSGRMRPAAGWLRYAVVCAGILVVAAVAEVAVRRIEPRALPFSPAAAVAAASDPGSCLGASALAPSHHCAELNRGDSVAPLPGALPDATGGAYACYAYAGEPIHPCAYGSTRPDAIRVALVGDSHAAALLPALETRLVALNWRVTAYTGNSCRWIPAGPSPTCVGLEAMQSDLLHGHYQVVISTEIRLATDPASAHLAVMRPVAATGAKIVVVEDDPSVSAASVACVGRITYRPTGGCGTPVRVAYTAPDRLAQAAALIPGAVVIPTERFYCRDGFCPSTIGNVIVYRDSAAHVTADYAVTVGPYLVAEIVRALPQDLR